jgi:hypothetical protein
MVKVGSGVPVMGSSILSLLTCERPAFGGWPGLVVEVEAKDKSRSFDCAQDDKFCGCAGGEKPAGNAKAEPLGSGLIPLVSKLLLVYDTGGQTG